MSAATLIPPSECYSQTIENTGRFIDRDVLIELPSGFTFEHGSINGPVHIKARLVGTEGAPVILALGGISANRFVVDSTEKSGWWNELVGEQGIIDTRQFRILSFDFLPEDDFNQPFPITTTDQARLAKIVCNYFQIAQLKAFLGASYGGMIALQFGMLFPDAVEQLIVVCAAHRPHPMGIAWRSIQRKIVQFGLETEQPERALSLARELGMTTYRTSEEFGHRFALPGCQSSKEPFEVEKYLTTRGQAFIGKMSPERYLSLSKSIDLHYVDPQNIQVPVSLIGFKQDQLVPIEEVRSLYQQLPQPAQYFEHDSLYGHDGFLKEIPFLSQLMPAVLAHSV